VRSGATGAARRAEEQRMAWLPGEAQFFNGRLEEGSPAVPAARAEAAVGCCGAHVRASQQP
jgi:hypothetical protein